MSESNHVLPSKEIVEYGRGAVQHQLDIVDRWIDEGGEEAEARWGRTAYILRRLLGGDGCVVAAFDARYLDDEFRQIIESAIGPGYRTQNYDAGGHELAPLDALRRGGPSA